jgi:hypothetical protein
MEALQACAASDGGKQTLANAVAISSGGAPIFLVAEGVRLAAGRNQ